MRTVGEHVDMGQHHALGGTFRARRKQHDRRISGLRVVRKAPRERSGETRGNQPRKFIQHGYPAAQIFEIDDVRSTAETRNSVL